MACLEGWGIGARLIVGAGGGPCPDAVCLPMMHPEAVVHMMASDVFPATDHPIVRSLTDDLRTALLDCTDCWVHNALTVFLNPFLTVALRLLAVELRQIRWVAWCEDISSTSAYWDGPNGASLHPMLRAVPGVRYVTITETRRRELARVLAQAEGQITVIPPPVDALRLLRIGSRGQEIAADLDIAYSMPVVLVPAKLLPHKNLSRCVALVAALRMQCKRPLMLITAAPSPHEPERSRVLAEQLRALACDAGVEDCFRLLADAAGVLDHGTVRDLMLLSDVVFLPSMEEGYGLPIQEASALRVPLLCSRIPAFEEASAGPFFDADQADEAIARMILELATRPGNLARRAALQSQDRFRTQLAELLCG